MSTTAELINNLLNNEEELTKITTQAFTETDTDQSGEISLDEFLVAFNEALTSLGIPTPTREQSQEVFNSLDTDQSGRLDRAEFRVFVVNMLELLAATFPSA